MGATSQHGTSHAIGPRNNDPETGAEHSIVIGSLSKRLCNEIDSTAGRNGAKDALFGLVGP